MSNIPVFKSYSSFVSLVKSLILSDPQFIFLQNENLIDLSPRFIKRIVCDNICNVGTMNKIEQLSSSPMLLTLDSSGMQSTLHICCIGLS